MPVNEGYSMFTTYVKYLNRFLSDTVESNYSACFLNLVEDDASIGGDGSLSNEGASEPEKKGVNEGVIVDVDPYVGGVFHHSPGDGPPTRVRFLDVVSFDSSKDEQQMYMVSDEEGNKFEATQATLIAEDVVVISMIPQTGEDYC